MSQSNSHEGHRKRFKDEFLNNGFNEFTPQHKVLEGLLFYSIPRKDTNVIAHNLLRKFGSISRVFNAPVEELVQVEGISENSAVLLKMIPDIARIYVNDMGMPKSVLRSTDEIGTYLLQMYVGFTDERLGVLSLNNSGKVLSFDIVNKGDMDSVGCSTRTILETLLRTKATCVVLAHNHPGGIALPSSQDLATTAMINKVLANVGIKLLDHIIIADGDYVSLALTDRYSYLFKSPNNYDLLD